MTDLVTRTLREFTESLASDSPAPGGGSAAAAAGAAGAGLLGMVLRLTLGKEKYRDAWEELAPLLAQLDSSRERLLELVDEDTRAYEAIVAARKLPKETGEEKARRRKALDDATVLATATPMQTAFFAGKTLGFSLIVFQKGNPYASSDAWVAGLLLGAAVEGALANVRINLPEIADPEVKRGFSEDAEDLAKKSSETLAKLREAARARGL